MTSKKNCRMPFPETRLKKGLDGTLAWPSLGIRAVPFFEVASPSLSSPLRHAKKPRNAGTEKIAAPRKSPAGRAKSAGGIIGQSRFGGERASEQLAEYWARGRQG